MSEDADMMLLKAATARLAEHFDTVRIIVTKHEGSNTIMADWGAGNWYGQKASVEEWLLRQEAMTRGHVPQRVHNENDDD